MKQILLGAMSGIVIFAMAIFTGVLDGMDSAGQDQPTPTPVVAAYAPWPVDAATIEALPDDNGGTPIPTTIPWPTNAPDEHPVTVIPER
jgi:hypothetical protein